VEVDVMSTIVRSLPAAHGDEVRSDRRSPERRSESPERRSESPELRVVRASAPRRPAWRGLYGIVVVVLGLGGLATWRTDTDAGRQAVALVMAAVILAAMAAWVRGNRVALSRLGEPASGSGRLSARVIRSRRRALDGDRIVRLAPGDAMPPCDASLIRR
jgi:hypothetical protein